MRLKTTAVLLVSLAMMHFSNYSMAQIKVAPDETDLPPPMVLQQKGVTAEEYAKALTGNRNIVTPTNPDTLMATPTMSGASAGTELTAQAHQAMIDAAREAGAISPLSPQDVKMHVQGENDEIPGQDGARQMAGTAPRVAPHPESAPPTGPDEMRNATNAPGDQQRNFATIANSGWIPPDTQLGVGGGFVVSATNSHYAVYNLDGALQTAPLVSFASFFAPVLPPGWAGNLFDPKVVYNPWNGRWVMLVLGRDTVNQSSRYFIAFSQSSDPRGGWWLYGTVNNDFATDSWLDYSGLAVDPWGVYTSGNMFLWAGGFKFSMMRHHDLDGYDGGFMNWYTRWDLQWPSGSAAFTMQPALAHSSNQLNGGTTFFVNTFSGSGNQALLWKLSGHTGPDAPAGTLSRTVVDVDQYYALGENVVQPGSGTALDGGDSRVLNAIYSQNNVYATLTNDLNNTADRGSVYTFRIGTDTNTKEWASNLHAPGYYYTYPAVTIKGSGGDTSPVGVYMSITHDDANPALDIFASAGVKLYEVPESNNDGVFGIYRAGQAAYVNTGSGTRNRWGDYSGAAYDWSCPGRMWGGAEFAGAGNTWGTQAAAYMMDNSNTSCAGEAPNQVQTSAPNGDIIDTTPTFVWSKPAGPTVLGFRLIVSKVGVTQYSLDLSTADTACASDSGCEFTPASVLTPGGHSFTVEALNGFGYGPISNARNFNLILPAPPNDNYANAIGIGEGSVGGTLTGATLDGSTSGAGATQKDVWYRHVVTGDGTLRANTCGSQALDGLDTVLSMHTDTGVPGTAADELTLNDDWQGSNGDPTAACPDIRDSSAVIDAAIGDVVLIRVSRFSASTDGAFTLNLAFELDPPPNDSFADAVSIDSGGGQPVGTLLGATSDGSSSADSPTFPGAEDVWYRYVAGVDGTLRVDTCGSLNSTNINTVLSVHADTGVAGTLANELAANDDWQSGGDPTASCSGTLDSSVALFLSGGDAVLIRVTRGDNIGGLGFNLNVSFEIEPVMDFDGDTVPDNLDNCTLVPNPDQRDSNGDGFGNLCDADLNGDCNVNPIDLGILKGVFFSSDPDSDLNGDGTVNPVDLGIFKSLFFAPPGPSGLADCT